MSPAHGLGLDHECCSCLERIEANICIAKKQRKHTKALSNCWTKDTKRLGLQESQWPPKQSILRPPAFNAHHWLFTRKAKLSCLELGRVTFETLDLFADIIPYFGLSGTMFIGLQIIYIHLLMKILLLLPLTLISFWGRIRRIHWQQNLLVKSFGQGRKWSLPPRCRLEKGSSAYFFRRLKERGKNAILRAEDPLNIQWLCNSRKRNMSILNGSCLQSNAWILRLIIKTALLHQQVPAW